MVLQRYGLTTQVRTVTALKATHRALRIDTDSASYALRQFNPFMTADDLATQACLALALSEMGLPTPPPLPANDGNRFVQAEDRLWALFSWCEGRPGDSEKFEDLVALVEAQGTWAQRVDRVRQVPHWSTILSAAKRFRRRKDWARIVPLDELPRFVDEVAMPALSAFSLPDKQADGLRRVLPAISDATSRLRRMLDAQSVWSLPHMISHGDLWASNICIGESKTCILDLDCFSYEPRITDFARAAHWYHASHSPEENRFLMNRFRSLSNIDPEEMEALPALIFAHKLYYLVGAALRFPTESEVEQAGILRDIGVGLRRLEEWDREESTIREAFLVG